MLPHLLQEWGGMNKRQEKKLDPRTKNLRQESILQQVVGKVRNEQMGDQKADGQVL